jgi:aryl carrier-like protein
MARLKKSHGVTVLYRTTNKWNVFDEHITPQEIESVVRSCKLATMSPWVWWGAPAIADWLVANPTTKEEEMPVRVRRAALKQVQVEEELLKRGMDFVRAMVITLEQSIRPTQREVRKAQKAAASRRKR